MVINDIKKEVKIKTLENGTTLRDLAKKIGTTGQYVSYVLGLCVVNKTFIKIMEGLGYDIKLVYVKRDDSNDSK